MVIGFFIFTCLIVLLLMLDEEYSIKEGTLVKLSSGRFDKVVEITPSGENYLKNSGYRPFDFEDLTKVKKLPGITVDYTYEGKCYMILLYTHCIDAYHCPTAFQRVYFNSKELSLALCGG